MSWERGSHLMFQNSAPLKIDVVCTDPKHPIMADLQEWSQQRSTEDHDVSVIHRLDDLRGGDLLLLVACHDIVSPQLRGRYRHALVTHASDLPIGRGWSPMVWTIVEGRNRVVVSLIEAADNVDTGAVWAKTSIELQGHEVFDEINTLYFSAIVDLLNTAVRDVETSQPVPQDDRQATWRRRRTLQDSRIDPEKSIAEQFDLLRIVDPARYPAWFELRGHVYELHLRKHGPMKPRTET